MTAQSDAMTAEYEKLWRMVADAAVAENEYQKALQNSKVTMRVAKARRDSVARCKAQVESIVLQLAEGARLAR